MTAAAVILLGFILAQIAAICLRRRWRPRFDSQVRELYGYAHLPLQHWRKVEFYKRASRGGWASLRRFARTPARLFRVEGAPPDPEEDHPTHPLHVWIRATHDIAAKLEWAAHPIAFGLTATVGSVVLLSGQVAGLARGKRPNLSRANIWRAATGELLLSARAAFDHRLTPDEVLRLKPTVRDPSDAGTATRKSILGSW